MKVIVEQKDLQRIVHAAAMMAESGPLVALSNILLRAEGETLRADGTNIQSLVSVSCEADVREPGRTAVSAQVLKDISKLLPDGESVEINATEGMAIVTCASIKYQLPTIPANDFPEWRQKDRVASFDITAAALSDALDSVYYAIANKENRIALTGARFSLSGNTLTLIGTTGKTLSRVRVDIPDVEGSDCEAVIPKRAVEVTKTLFRDGAVRVSFSDEQFRFESGDTAFETNAISAKYPTVEKLIPTEYALIRIPFHRDALALMIKRGVAVANKAHGGGRLIILNFGDNKCRFSAYAHDRGKYGAEMPVEYNGKAFERAVSAPHLLETLAHLPSPEAEIAIKSLDNETYPIGFRCVKHENRISLQMPVRLDSSILTVQENSEESDND